jgi:pimeloyl-ACP methyl ester carboxylesterase
MGRRRAGKCCDGPIRAGRRDPGQVYAEGAFDPPVTRAALAQVAAPVLMHAGELEIGPTAELAAEMAGLFPGWELAIQPGAGHYPWLDDPAWFTSALLEFLT